MVAYRVERACAKKVAEGEAEGRRGGEGEEVTEENLTTSTLTVGKNIAKTKQNDKKKKTTQKAKTVQKSF